MKQDYLQYIEEFHGNNSDEILFINSLDDKESYKSTDIEHILDFMFSTNKSFNWVIWYKTILQKANKWMNTLNRNTVIKDGEVEWVDYETVKEWEKGFSVVKLISEDAFKREWKLMSHCVSSYADRWNNEGDEGSIFSLRDDKNKPHCTIEWGNQIKWKGNWLIHPKYIDYIIDFMESKWMDMRSGEMTNLWYKDVSLYKEAVKNDLYKWNYLYNDDTLKLKRGWKVITKEEILSNW